MRKIALFLSLFFALTATAQFEFYQEGFHKEVLSLQILLERQNLSCNCVDGFWGERTEIAFMTWQVLNGLTPDGIPTTNALAALSGGTSNTLFQSFTVTQSDLNDLVVIPSDWEEKAAMKSMGFQSILEQAAEMGHTTPRTVQRLNPDITTWPNPPAGTQITLPDCEWTQAQKRARKKAKSMRISLSRREITLFDAAENLIALFPCSIARNKEKRPEGELTVKTVAENPTYLYDPQLFHPGSAKTKKFFIPAGPNNPVGVAWVGLSKSGYGIHGTPEPQLIGQAASHGCFRLANWNAKRLVKFISYGMPMLVEE